MRVPARGPRPRPRRGLAVAVPADAPRRALGQRRAAVPARRRRRHCAARPPLPLHGAVGGHLHRDGGGRNRRHRRHAARVRQLPRPRDDRGERGVQVPGGGRLSDHGAGRHRAHAAAQRGRAQ